MLYNVAVINRYRHKDTVWVDLSYPTPEEVRKIVSEFSVHPSVAHELVSPTEKPRIELHDNYIYAILHFPVIKHGKDNKGRHEMDFIIGRNFLITTRYESIAAVENFTKMVEVNSILDREFSEDRSGILFFGIMREIYQALLNELEYIESWLTKIEEGVFAGKEREMVENISRVSRSLLNFKRSISFHKEVLGSLEIYGRKIFNDQFTYLARRSLDEYQRVEDALESNIATTLELRETNNSLLSTKQNETMKILTVVTFIFSPLALVAALFQIDLLTMPIVGQPNDFWILGAVLAIIGIFMYGLFKIKKWL